MYACYHEKNRALLQFQQAAVLLSIFGPLLWINVSCEHKDIQEATATEKPEQWSGEEAKSNEEEAKEPAKKRKLIVIGSGMYIKKRK